MTFQQSMQTLRHEVQRFSQNCPDHRDWAKELVLKSLRRHLNKIEHEFNLGMRTWAQVEEVRQHLLLAELG